MLKGGPQLRARLRAIGQSFKPLGKDWADEAAQLMRARVPVKTGRLQRSIRRRNASAKKATVVAHYSAYFVDAGTKAHDVEPKKATTLRWNDGGNIRFAKKVHIPRVGPRPFRAQAAREALQRNDPLKNVIEAWNHAA